MQDEVTTASPVYKRIRLHIQSKKIPLREVAIKAGIPIGRFYRIMDGTSTLNADEVEKICNVEELGLDPNGLLRP